MLDALISAGTKLLGGILGDKATEKNNAQNLAFQREQLDRNEALQREFATSGIQWKVADAEKAGVHPLYALGANTTSFSPITMSAGSEAKRGVGDALSDMGQDVSRAIRATASDSDRAYNDAMKRLNLRKAGLENDLLASQIAKNSGTQVGPAMPIGPTAAGPVPEDTKFGSRPRLAAGDTIVVRTDPTISNAEDYEKRYGDESAASKMIGNYIFARDAWHHTKPYRDAFDAWTWKMENAMRNYYKRTALGRFYMGER